MELELPPPGHRTPVRLGARPRPPFVLTRHGTRRRRCRAEHARSPGLRTSAAIFLPLPAPRRCARPCDLGQHGPARGPGRGGSCPLSPWRQRRPRRPPGSHRVRPPHSRDRRLRPFCTASPGTCFAGCSRRMGRDGAKSEAGRTAGPSPSQQQDEPREAEVTHRDREGKLHQLNLKSWPGGFVRSFHYYPRKNAPDRENGSDTEKNFLALGV